MHTPSRLSRRWFLFLSLAAILSAPRASLAKDRAFIGPRKLDQRIESILHQNGAYRGLWGIEVVPFPEGKILYARNPEHLFVPASNMKLFTTAAAIEKLGQDFIFRTTVESDAAPDAQGRVRDLFLVGRGDPNLSERPLPYQRNGRMPGQADAVFQKLAAQLVAKGVREVTGDLIADDSRFLFEPYSHGWAEEDLVWGYGAPVTALAYNDNALLLHVQAGTAVGEPARIWLDPIGDYYQLRNRVETVAAGGEKRILIERAPGSKDLDVWGQVPLGTNDGEDRLAILNPPLLMGELFRRELEAQGIAVRGRVEVRHFARYEEVARAALRRPEPSPPVVLAEYDSPPLAVDIKVLNKVSQNLHAEMLLRTLARQTRNQGTLEAGLEVLREFAAQVGIAPGEFYFTDGSGLSRKTLVAPSAVVKLLSHMARSAQFSTFFDSLPVAGVDGTLAERFRGTPVAGRIHAKTGTIEHVNSLSGYIDLPSGRRLVFSILSNNHALSASEGPATVDRIALAIYEWYAGRHVRR